MLSWAAKEGREAVVRLPLEKSADLESNKGFGWKPLSWAAQYRYKASRQAAA